MARTRLKIQQINERIRLIGTSTGSSPVVLTTDGGAAGASNQLVIAGNSFIKFSGNIVAYEDAGNRVAEFELNGWLKRPGSEASGTTVLQAACFPGYLNQSTVTCSLTADTTNGAVAVSFSGVNGYTYTVECDLEYQEVGG